MGDACISSDAARIHQAGGKQVILEPTEADSAASQTPAKPGTVTYVYFADMFYFSIYLSIKAIICVTTQILFKIKYIFDN